MQKPGDHQDPAGRLLPVQGAPAEIEVAQAQLAILVGVGHEARGTGLRAEEDRKEYDPRTPHENAALYHGRPDGAFDPSDQGVDERESAHCQHDRSDVPARDHLHRHSRQVERETEVGDSKQREARRAVESRPVAEALLQVLVGAHLHGAPIQGDDERHQDRQHPERHQHVEHLPPVAREGGAGNRHEGRAADGRGHHRKPDGPAGDLAVGGEVLPGGRLAPCGVHRDRRSSGSTRITT